MKEYFRCEKVKQGITLKHSSGFFSCCSIAMHNISVFIENEGYIPNVDFSETFLKYMDANCSTGNDVYKQCFQLQEDKTSLTKPESFEFGKSSLFPYIEENYCDLKFFLEKWFHPSKEVLRIKRFLYSKYKIESENTLCVCFRGTDKYKDIEETSYETFCSKVDYLMSKSGLNAILVQTDQEQFLDYFTKNFSAYNIIVIAENPRRTDQEQVAFKLDVDKRVRSAQLFLATMLIMAESRYIINHTGNVARWINLFRGGAFNTIQYMTEQEICNLV